MTTVLALLPYIRDNSATHTRARHVIANMDGRMLHLSSVGIDEWMFTEIEPIDKWDAWLLRVPSVGRKTAFVLRAAVNDWLTDNYRPTPPLSLTAAKPWFEFAL